MTDKIELALNSAQCIKTESHFGSTVYHNICDGSQRVVEWGSADWALSIAGLSFVAILAALLAALVVAACRSLWW